MSHLLISELMMGNVITIETTSPTSGVEGGAAPQEARGLSGEEEIA